MLAADIYMTETDTQRLIQVALSWGDSRMFRNNVGEAWLGWNFTVRGGKLVGGEARRVAYGLAPGSSDLIGIQRFVVTPAMVGLSLGVFTAIEVKSKRGKEQENQEHFRETIQELGGIAGVARSVEDARRIVTPFAK